MKNEKWVVAEHMAGIPDVRRVYRKVEEDFSPRLKDEEMLLKTLYVAADLYLHGIALDTPLNDCMGADSVMEVIDRGANARFEVGDVVQGFGGWQRYLVHTGKEAFWQTGTFPMVFPAYRKLDPEIFPARFPLTAALGPLGGPGMTAWGSVSKILAIQPGKSLVVSGASGAVGELVGQLARLRGARVIGIVGSDEKIEHVKRLGFDRGINYKKASSLETMTQALREQVPEGIDRYFDSVGGYITDAVFPLLNVYSLVAICWQLATQLGIEPCHGPRLFPMIMFPRTTIRGIFSLEWFTEENWKGLIQEVGGHIESGEMRYHEVVYDGFDSIPQAYESLFRGTERTRGKVVVRI